MKKLILTTLAISFTLCSYGQSWFNTGNTLQRRIVGSDTSYRFSLGSPGFMYLYTKPQLDNKFLVVKDTTNAISTRVALKADSARLYNTVIPTLALKDSILRINSNLYDVADKAVGRTNLGAEYTGNKVTVLDSSLVNYPNTSAVRTGLYQKVKKTGDIMTGSLFFSTSGIDQRGIRWGAFSDGAQIYLESTGDVNKSSNQIFQVSDNILGEFGRSEGWKWRKTGTGDTPPQPTVDVAVMNLDQFLWRGVQLATVTQDGDIEITNSARGLILTSPDGTRYRIKVANGGTLTVTAL